MEVTSITQTKNMIIEQIRQVLSEKIECTEAKIQNENNRGTGKMESPVRSFFKLALKV